MRKLAFFALVSAAFLLHSFSCKAQDWMGNRLEFRAGVSSAPTLDRIAESLSIFRSKRAVREPLYTIESLYDEYRGESYSSPAFGVMAGVNVMDWVTLSLRGDLVNIYTPYFNPLTDEQTRILREYVVYVMGDLRLSYVQMERFRVYSSFTWGVQFNNTTHLYDRPQGSMVMQLTPVGVTFAGDTFFFFTELGVGSVYCGVGAGVGIRL